VKKVIAISLSLILLLGNMGLSVATHYCGGHAVKSGLRLGGATFDCGMKESGDRVWWCEREGVHFNTSRCCDNLQQVVHTDDTSPVTTFSLTASESPCVSPPFSFDFPCSRSFGKNTTFFYNPPPPLPQKDRQILFQTFLI
jgi:hypothetical protein